MELSKFKTKAWAWTLAIGLILWFCGPIRPDGVSLAAWHMFAIFVATIVGCITQPLPIAGTTLVGFTVMVLVGLAPMKGALTACSPGASSRPAWDAGLPWYSSGASVTGVWG